MKKVNTYLTGIAVATALTSGAHAAVVFQFDYQMSGGVNQNTALGWTGVDAPKNASDDNASAPGTRSDTAGGVTATLTTDTNGSWITARGGDSENRGTAITGTSWNGMVEDTIAARGGSGTVTVNLSGLTSGLTYTLTTWHNDSFDGAGANPGFAVDLGHTITPSIVAGSIVGTVDLGASTNVRDGARSDSDFDTSVISFTTTGTTAEILLDSASTGNYLIISGMQLTSVPEPSSAALLGLGGFALILRRRK